MSKLQDTLNAWRNNESYQQFHDKFNIRKAAFLEKVKQINYESFIIYEPANDINFYDIRYHFGKGLQNLEITNKFLKNNVNKNIPLSFPHIIISGWSPWFTIIWERYIWRGEKFRHLPEFSLDINLTSQNEVDFLKLFNSIGRQSELEIFMNYDNVLLKRFGPLNPWNTNEDLQLAEVLFGAAFHIYNII